MKIVIVPVTMIKIIPRIAKLSRLSPKMNLAKIAAQII